MTLLLVLAQACLALGIFSSAAAALAATGFCLGCTRDGFDPDCPTRLVRPVSFSKVASHASRRSFNLCIGWRRL